MLESVKLHEVVPKILYNGLLLRQKTFPTMVPTCDDNLISEFKQDLDLNYSI
jgi:hypothetical protein